MESMEKISRFKIVFYCLLTFFSITSCISHNFENQINKNHRYSKKIYNKYLKEYGNASMIITEGNFSIIWYYQNNAIHITRVKKSKISANQEYECDNMINIKDYKLGCYTESLDAELFLSSLYDIETDSLYEVGVCLVIDELKCKETACPVIKELRNHIIKYKLWE